MKTDIALLLCLSTFTAFAQQSSGDHKDNTLSSGRVTIFDPGISLGRPTLLLPPSLRNENSPDMFPFLLPGGTRGVPPPFLGGLMEQKADLTSPLRLQMESEAKLRPLWMVLGTVQAGGAAYAAYRYIKKHGLK